jgi:hypothetical protein
MPWHASGAGAAEHLNAASTAHPRKNVGPAALLQRQPPAKRLLLCCLCADNNTVYSCEVVYRRRSDYDTWRKALAAEAVNDADRDHEYYNFPPRHPRHGHLKWPVYQTEDKDAALCLSYPDYPVHIRTTTLKRNVVNGVSPKSKYVRKKRLRKNKTSKKSGGGGSSSKPPHKSSPPSTRSKADKGRRRRRSSCANFLQLVYPVNPLLTDSGQLSRLLRLLTFV